LVILSAAVSRKKEKSANYLHELGAKSVLSVADIPVTKPKPLAKPRWSAII